PMNYIREVADKYGFNFRGSGKEIEVKFNQSLASAGKSRELTPGIIELGPKALVSEEELARTLAHELNHARSWLKGGRALEAAAYAAEEALSEYMAGLR